MVLEDITFDIKKGEVALIIGASGSGKTTLLKMLGKSMIPEGDLVESRILRQTDKQLKSGRSGS